MKTVLLALLLSFGMALPAMAEPISADTLRAQGDKCRNECETANGQLICRVLCDCAMDSFAKSFDNAGFEAYLKQLEDNTLSAANMAVTQNTQKMCLGQVELILRSLQQQEESKNR